MTNKELIASDDFEKAVEEAASYKNNAAAAYKSQNKSTFAAFDEIMHEANDSIKSILSKKKKNRTDADNKELADFKNAVRAMYSQVQSLSLREDLEEGQKSKIDKIVDKIVPVIDILRYIGNAELENVLAKQGICIQRKKLEERYPALADQAKMKQIQDLFSTAASIKQKAQDDNIYINTDLFQTKVPTALQFDKGSNNSGLKSSDFRKIVDMKAKLLAATSKEAKDKADEKVQDQAEEKQFEIARAELVRDSLSKLQ